jgi:hypothetical protein
MMVSSSKGVNMPGINLLQADPRLTIATFAQDLFEQIHLRAKTGDFKAGLIGTDYYVLIGNEAFSSKSKDEAWTVAFGLLFNTTEPTPELRAKMDLAGETISEEDITTPVLIEALTEGGMTALGRATEQAREERKGKLKEVLPKFLASHGAFDSVESMLESLASETGISFTAMEVQQARTDLNI